MKRATLTQRVVSASGLSLLGVVGAFAGALHQGLARALRDWERANLRYARELRDDPRQLERVLLTTMMGTQVQRLRPIAMTVTAIISGLLPIMWATGSGSDVMKRIAAPMVGGMVSTTVLSLVVLPAVYLIWRAWQVRRAEAGKARAQALLGGVEA